MKSCAIEGHFSVQNLIDDAQILIELVAGFRFQAGKDRQRFLQFIRAASIASGFSCRRDDGDRSRSWRRSCRLVSGFSFACATTISSYDQRIAMNWQTNGT